MVGFAGALVGARVGTFVGALVVGCHDEGAPDGPVGAAVASPSKGRYKDSPGVVSIWLGGTTTVVFVFAKQEYERYFIKDAWDLLVKRL